MKEEVHKKLFFEHFILQITPLKGCFQPNYTLFDILQIISGIKIKWKS